MASETNPDVIAVSETWLVHHSAAELVGYSSHRADRADGRGGGVCLYVRLDRPAKEINSSVLNSARCEQIWRVVGEPPGVIIGCVYRPPDPTIASDVDRAIASSIADAARYVSRGDCSDMILMGDLNLPDIDWSESNPSSVHEDAAGHLIVEAAEEACLTQIVTEPTFFSNDYSSLLDVIFVSFPNRASEVRIGPQLGTAVSKYHASLEMTVILDTNSTSTTRFDSRRFKYKTGDYDSLNRFFGGHDWTRVLENHDVQQAYRRLLDVYEDGCNRFIDLKRKPIGRPKPKWWTSSIAKAVRVKRRLFIRCSSSKWKNATLNNEYKNHCKHLSFIITSEIKNFESKLAELAIHNPKPLFSYVNQRFQTLEVVSALTMPSGELNTDRQDICDQLNDYFQSVFSPESSNDASERLRQRMGQIVEPANINIDSLTSMTSVSAKLSALNIYKSMGHDQLSPYVLKNAATSIAFPLSLIFRESLGSSVVPNEWREANVTPIHKGGSRSVVSNYRPISLTSVACKVLESLIKDAMMTHLQQSGVLSTKQHGFLPKRSCVTNLLETVDFLTDCMNRKQPADAVYLDFAKAFDKVSHKLLLVKLEAYGFAPELVSWVRSFLTNRRQRVVMGEFVSAWRPVTSGVPQGSVLGPLLFLVYINDMPNVVKSATIKLFADDAKLLMQTGNQDDKDRLQDDLDQLVEWATESELLFNYGKCKVLHVGPKNEQHSYHMSDTPLAASSCERDLGVMISNDLKPSAQVKKAAARASFVAHRLTSTFTFWNERMLSQLYKSFIRPHLEFSSVVWSPWARKDIDALETIQRRVSKLAPSLRNMTYSERLDRLEWPLLAERRTRADLIEMHKIEHELVQVHFVNGNQRRAASQLDSPASNTRNGHRGLCRGRTYNCEQRYNFFLNRTAGSWNALPSAIKDATNTITFKKLLDKELESG